MAAFFDKQMTGEDLKAREEQKMMQLQELICSTLALIVHLHFCPSSVSMFSGVYCSPELIKLCMDGKLSVFRIFNCFALETS